MRSTPESLYPANPDEAIKYSDASEHFESQLDEAYAAGVRDANAVHASRAIDRMNEGKSEQVSFRRLAILDVLAHSVEPLSVRVLDSLLRQSSGYNQDKDSKITAVDRTWEIDYSEKQIREDLRVFEEHKLVTAHPVDYALQLNRRYGVSPRGNTIGKVYEAAPEVVDLFVPVSELSEDQSVA